MTRFLALLTGLFLVCIPVLAKACPLGATAMKPLTTYTLQIQGASIITSTAFGDDGQVETDVFGNSGTKYHPVDCVRVYSDVLAHITIAGTSAATATTTDMPILAGVIEYFSVQQGQYIAVIDNSTNGTVYITEMTR